MMELIHDKLNELSDQVPVFDKVVVGLSGGRDSIFLLHVLLDFYGSKKIIALHLDHGLREESIKDVQFVKGHCHSLGVEFVSKRIEVLALKKKASIENNARIIRYNWFAEICEKNNGILFCGHTLTDQLETVIMNIQRGSGLSGLKGISFLQKNFGVQIVRPLIEMERSRITSYLDEKNITYLDDPSNESFKFTRNKIRLGLRPRLGGSSILSLCKIITAAKKLDEKLIIPKSYHTKSCVWVKLEDFSNLSAFAKNKLVDLVYQKLSIQGTPGQQKKIELFDFAIEEQPKKMQLSSSVFCEKSRGWLGFFKECEPVERHNIHQDSFEWSVGPLLKEEMTLDPSFLYYVILPENEDGSNAQRGTLNSLEGLERKKVKKKIESFQNPSFLYNIWPIVSVNNHILPAKPIAVFSKEKRVGNIIYFWANH